MRHTQNIAVLVAVSICWSMTALAAKRKLVAQFSSYDFNQGRRYDFGIYEDELSRTPPWRTEEEFPPLSPRKAEASAREQLEKLVEQSERWNRRSIALHQMSGGDKWVYVIHFSGFHPRGVIDGLVPEMKLVVLMNGQVVRPRISPYGKGKRAR